MKSQTSGSILYQMTHSTPTALWNDSCSIQELTASIRPMGRSAPRATP